MAGHMAGEGPAADPMSADDLPYAAGGESARNQELLAKVATLNAEKEARSKTIADLIAKKEADAKTIADLEVDKARLVETNKSHVAVAAHLMSGVKPLLETNAALVATNTAIVANNTAIADANTAIADANIVLNIRSSKAVHMAQYFKKAYLREKHMRHKSDRRHGAQVHERR